MGGAEEFEELRPLLSALAHRMLGEAGAAQEVVRRARLLWQSAPAQPSARGFLVAAVTRMALDVLTAAAPPQPPHPPRRAGGEDAGLAAALALIEGLSPAEHAVFVLREVFGCGFADIAAALGCSQAACRQLAAALGPAGGAARVPWPRRIEGAQNVARALGAIVPPLHRIGITLEHRQVGGRPAGVLRDRSGHDLGALVLLDIADGHIRALHLGSSTRFTRA
ncbi:sigma factor-like helix-turn-helix DNA-binding protein [Streptomyces sp. NPDC059063]|uniref:sigma factor-like helix-turn-helix DNA-binding protein n=1 Tax=unclassified Streptomyces TaxID=2593676 RepID=UPI00369A607A